MLVFGMPTSVSFLSTLSLRRATRSGGPWQAGYTDFYPRSPCGERQREKLYAQRLFSDFYPRSPCGERLLTEINKLATGQISIHALLAESDHQPQERYLPAGYFYPRSPCGERPYGALKHVHVKEISIHALLAESDKTCTMSKPKATYFYPRSPCGERQRFG